MPVAPPRPKGPPLNALRAFEAAARLGSFAAAADELSVTAGAISQQIKQIEGWAGTALFIRRAQGVALTSAGRELLAPLTRAFDNISEATTLLRSLSPKPVLNIATLPSIAQLWLQPRLAKLRAALGAPSLSVYALESPPDMRRAPFDCSLFLRSPTSAATEMIIEQDSLLPVCAPSVAARLHTLQDLTRETLLYDESWQNDWPLWAKTNGLTLAPNQSTARYSLYALALADAKAGFGVLMGHVPLVQDALGKGDLVAPFDLALQIDKALVLELGPAAPQDLALRLTA
ncbi:LysR family transcriptional regulator [Lentibacter sp. XHP0401]|uniref:LysR family transcriptional regulator n=1 Tax=Lentibacter sp. XHP0401 TaxID=2984334 RepID=UPI0021E740AD|nr:LysR family transcriptional regulator [Lentibacter sp. XHP0401]MCV2891727.1 LysR family transcriptional regulator [Lentibacter sp. XHP0401]